PLQECPCSFLVLALCLDGAARDTAVAATHLGANRQNLQADLVRRQRGSLGIDGAVAIDAAPVEAGCNLALTERSQRFTVTVANRSGRCVLQKFRMELQRLHTNLVVECGLASVIQQ